MPSYVSHYVLKYENFWYLSEQEIFRFFEMCILKDYVPYSNQLIITQFWFVDSTPSLI